MKELVEQIIKYAQTADIGWWAVVAGIAVVVVASQARGIIKDILAFRNERTKINAEISRNVYRDAELIRQKQEKYAKKIAKSQAKPKIRKT